MPDTPQSLQDGAMALGAAASQARAWVARVARSASIVASEERSLLNETRSAENFARKLSVSATRRTSVGVFGPSQAGKSYLVSVLGRSADGPLIADFAGIRKNFIQEVNPGGGKESTGLVTRFTIVKGTQDSAYPVELRLLTETDLVKILGNSFLSDFSQQNRRLNLQAEDEIRDGIAALEGAAGAQATHIDEIAMFDIGEYFQTNYSAPTKLLGNAGYWDALTRFGARLPLAKRVALYSILWGGHREITDVFLLMQSALEKLGHPLSARCVLEGLLPRERSLINVDLVKDDLGTVPDQKDLVAVVPERADGSDGAMVQVARATLTALTAELKIVMSAALSPFFEHTDLLDFPGARSREQMADFDPDPEKRAAEIRNMVRRGKVSYLFQRYTEERELSSMMLCMPPKPAEVKDLTVLVRQWVEQTHGKDASQRAQLPCALFFVLTFFDEEMKSKPGDTPAELRNRIEARIESSMFGLYKHEDWFQNWAPGLPFNNTYFMRNPEFVTPGIIEYDTQGGRRREVGIAADARPLLDNVYAGMMASENAGKHFFDRERAWTEAVSLNNGGAPYLISMLNKVLSPELKARQLASRLLAQAKRIDEHFRRFYQADDEQSRKKKDLALLEVRRDLYRACVSRSFRNFFQLLSCMKLDESEVRGVFLNVGLRPDAGQGAIAAAPAPAALPEAARGPWDDDDIWSEPPPTAESAGARGKPAKAQRLRDRYDDFARQAINLWTDRLRGISANATLLTALQIDGHLISDIVNEMVVGANRLELGDRIADRVRLQVDVAGLRPEDAADRSAGIATTLVNDFVAYLGFADQPLDKRPGFPEAPKPRSVAVFEPSPMPVDDEIPALGDQRQPLERNYFRDWGISLRQLGLENISHSGGRQISEDDNRVLGQILGGLAPTLLVGGD